MARKGKLNLTIGVDDGEFKRKIKRVGSSLDNLKSSALGFGGALGAIGGALALREIGQIADRYTLLDSRLKLVTKSQQEFAQVQQRLSGISRVTRQDYEQTASLYTNVARGTKELGLSTERLTSFVEGLNKAIIVSGASSEEAANGTRQMTQALQGGVVRAEEYNSMMEQTPRILEAVADGLGVTMGELRAEMLEGQLSAKRFIEGFEKGAASVDEEFSQMTPTIQQANTVLMDAFESIVNGANNSSGATESISQSILDLADTVTDNKEEIISLFVKMIELAGATVEAVSNIAQSFEGWSAVSEGRLSFFEFATMNAEELNEWLKKNNQDLGALTISASNYIATMEKAGESSAKSLAKTGAAATKTAEKVGWIGFRAKESWEIFAKGAEEADARTKEMMGSIDTELNEFFSEIDNGTVQMTNSFSDFFDVTLSLQQTFTGALQGEFESIGDAFKNLMSNMVASFMASMAKMAAEWLAKKAMGLFTGGSGGGGSSGPISGVVSKIPVVGGILGGALSIFGLQEGGLIPSVGYASGGVLQGGSGFRDDLYLGRVGGNNVFAQGGEYITNKKSTDSNLGTLMAINDRGGITPAVINVNIGGQTIESLVLEVVDGHIVERNARGLTTERIY